MPFQSTIQLEEFEPRRRRFLSRLRRTVGRKDFYYILADWEPRNAAKWNRMVQVQAEFLAAEAEYSGATRAYSESMRLTLHSAVVTIFSRPNKLKRLMVNDKFYRWFISMHATAFKANGACGMDSMDMITVMINTPLDMMYPSNLVSLFRGMLGDADRNAQVAAERTRRMRSARGMLTTSSGY